jgi:type IV secretory pathway component VirB8
MVTFTPEHAAAQERRQRIELMRRALFIELREAFNETRIARRAHVARGRRLQRTRRRIIAVALLIAAVAAVLALT